MLPLANILHEKGFDVSGSDRAFDKDPNTDKFNLLKNKGIALFPQDGSGVQHAQCLVVSSAVEETIPDVKAAKEKNIPIRKRGEVLADLFHQKKGVAIAGTSGKTTVTAMVSFILTQAGFSPDFLCGGQIKNFISEDNPGSYGVGQGDFFVSEMDESDNSIDFFNPEVGLLHNVSEDHKSFEELCSIFSNFVNRCKTIAINADHKVVQKIVENHKNSVSYGVFNKNADFYVENIKKRKNNIDLDVLYKNKRKDLSLSLTGEHNISNALAAIALCVSCGVGFSEAVDHLKDFKGVKRRFDIIGEKSGILVIDDFGHNPDKIEASLKALNDISGHNFVFFQPHGFGPLKMMKNNLVHVVSENLRENDVFIMTDPYYAGGTADFSVRASDIISILQEKKKSAYFCESREKVAETLKNAKSGDKIVIMGARDDTLTDFAHQILENL